MIREYRTIIAHAERAVAGAVRRCMAHGCKRAVALVTLACFLLTSVAGQGFASLAQERRDGRQLREILDSFSLPYTAGRVTDARYYGSRKVVINIQDLHCDGEVQKNIGKIIALLTDKYKISTVYQEGAIGKVDTSWLTSIKDGSLRKELVEALLERGELTGAEYYSAVSGKKGLITGLEDESLYTANVRRLNKIIGSEEKIRTVLAGLRDSLQPLKETYYGPKNKRLERLVNDYKNGKINVRKYYSILRKYGEKNGIDVYSYGNIIAYLDLIETEKGLNYKRVACELQDFMVALKQKLPYADYRALLERTDNFTKLDDLYTALPRLAARTSIDVSRDYPVFNRFLGYLEGSQKVNPLNLVKEEKKLVREIELSFAVNESEREVVFLDDFYRHLEDYVSNKISADDYRYFAENYGRFVSLGEQYGAAEQIAQLKPYCAILDEYYRVNLRRNSCFIENTLGKYTNGARIGMSEDHSDESARVIGSLAGADEILLTVTGGFHTAGYTELLKERNVSYIVITPNVTRETGPADIVYRELMEQQGKILTQTLGPLVLSERPFDARAQRVVTACVDVLVRKGYDASRISGEVNALIGDLKNSLSIPPESSFATVRFNFIKQDRNGDYQFEIVSTAGRSIFHYSAGEGRIVDVAISGSAPLNDKNALKARGAVLHRLQSLLNTFTARDEGARSTTDEIRVARTKDDVAFMREALKEADKAADERKFFSARVGAVVVKDGTIIGRGYNRKNNILHAEQFAIMDALRAMIEGSNLTQQDKRALLDRVAAVEKASGRYTGSNGDYLKYFADVDAEFEAIATKLGEGKNVFQGTTLVATLEPCKKCTRTINALSFDRVVFGAYATNNKAKGLTLFKDPGISISGGVLEKECIRLNRGYYILAGTFPLVYSAFQGVERFVLRARQRLAYVISAEKKSNPYEKLVQGGNKKLPLAAYIAAHPELYPSRKLLDDRVAAIGSRLTAIIKDHDKAVAASRDITDCVDILYRRMPDELFRRYYADANPLVAEHALLHSLSVIDKALDILKKEGPDSAREIDWKVLLFASLMHDISYLVSKDNHTEYSAQWLESILTVEQGFDSDTIERIAQVARGHRKVTDFLPRKEHAFVEARVLHDADLLCSATDIERIFRIKEAEYRKAVDRRGFFYNPGLTTDERVGIIKNGNFRDGDAVTDLMRQAWWQRDPALYLTDGGKRLVALEGISYDYLVNLIETRREEIKSLYGMQEYEIFEMLRTMQETFAALFGYDPMIPAFGPEAADEVAVSVARHAPQDITHFEALRLKSRGREFTVADALREQDPKKNWQPVEIQSEKPKEGAIRPEDVPASMRAMLKDVFLIPREDRRDLEAVLTTDAGSSIGELLVEAINTLPPKLQKVIASKKIRLTLIDEGASHYLCEDHSENGYAGINRAFLRIAEKANSINKELARNLFVVCIAHELYHEAGVLGENTGRDAALFHALMIKFEISTRDFDEFASKVYPQFIDATDLVKRGGQKKKLLLSKLPPGMRFLRTITESALRDINFVEAVQLQIHRGCEQFKQDLMNRSVSKKEKYQKTNFYLQDTAREHSIRELLRDEPNEQTLDEFIRRDSAMQASAPKVAAAIAGIERQLADLLPHDPEKAMRSAGYVREGIEVMHRWMTENLFKEYYTDAENALVSEHALPHCLSVIGWSLSILQQENVDVIDATDFRALIFAALMHDLACVIYRPNHERNSAAWSENMLRKEAVWEQGMPDALTDKDADKIAMAILGHKKTEGRGPRQEHSDYFEASVLHDADLLSAAMDLQRIYHVWTDKSKNPNKEMLFNKEITMERRLELLLKNEYMGGDGINDLMRNGWIRRNPTHYLTTGGRQVIEKEGVNPALLERLFENNRSHITQVMRYEPAQIDEMKRLVRTAYATLFGSRKNAYEDMKRPVPLTAKEMAMQEIDRGEMEQSAAMIEMGRDDLTEPSFVSLLPVTLVRALSLMREFFIDVPLGRFSARKQRIVNREAWFLSRLFLKDRPYVERARLQETLIEQTAPVSKIDRFFAPLLPKFGLATDSRMMRLFPYARVIMLLSVPLLWVSSSFTGLFDGFIFLLSAYSLVVLANEYVSLFSSNSLRGAGLASCAGNLFTKYRMLKSFSNSITHELIHKLYRRGLIKSDIPVAAACGALAEFRDKKITSKSFAIGEKLFRVYPDDPELRWKMVSHLSFLRGKIATYSEIFNVGQRTADREPEWSYLAGEMLAGMAYALASQKLHQPEKAWEYLRQIAMGSDPIEAERQITGSDKAQAVTHFEALKLRGQRSVFSTADAEKEKNSKTKTWVRVGGMTDVRFKYIFEMPLEDRNALNEVLKTDGELGALISRAVASLPADLQQKIRFKGEIRISLIDEKASTHLFEDHLDNGYIGINRTFLTIAAELGKSGHPLAKALLVTGLAHELYHEAGVVEEDIARDGTLFHRLLVEYGVPLEIFDESIGSLADYFEADEFAAAVRLAASGLLPAVPERADFSVPVSLEGMINDSAVAAGRIIDRQATVADTGEPSRVEFNLPASYEDRIEQSARALLPYSGLLAAVNILCAHNNMQSVRKITCDLYSSEDSAVLDGEVLHLSFASPRAIDTLSVLAVFNRGLGWDFTAAIKKVSAGYPYLLLAADDFDAINIVLHGRLAGMGDLVFIVNTGQSLREVFPHKKIRLIFHSEKDCRLIGETKLIKDFDPDAAVQERGGIEIVNAYSYAQKHGTSSIPQGKYWELATGQLVSDRDISIVYALGANEKDVLGKSGLYKEYGGRARGKIFVHELGFRMLSQNPLANGDAHIGVGANKVGMAPVSPVSRKIYADKYRKTGTELRAERRRIIKKFPGWEILNGLLHQSDLERTVSSDWGFIYSHEGQNVAQYFNGLEVARKNSPAFAAKDKTVFLMCGRSDQSVHRQMQTLAEKNDYNLLVYNDTAPGLEQVRTAKDGKVTVIMDYSVPRKLFGELFLYSDDLPSVVSGQDNLANTLYLNQISDGRPFFWELLMFHMDAYFDLLSLAEKALGATDATRLRHLWEGRGSDSEKAAAEMFTSYKEYQSIFKRLAAAVSEQRSFMPQMYYLMLRQFDRSGGLALRDKKVQVLLDGMAGERQVAPGSIQALGVNATALLREVSLDNPLLAQFLVRPSVYVAESLIRTGVFRKEAAQDVLTDMMRQRLEEELRANSNELGIEAAKDEIRTEILTLLPVEFVAGKDHCLLASLGIERQRTPEKINSTVFLSVHAELREYLLGCLKGDGMPQGFLNVDNCVTTLVEHEVNEYLALNRPQSVIGKLFSVFLEIKGMTGDARTSENFHKFIADSDFLNVHLPRSSTLRTGLSGQSALLALMEMVHQTAVEEKEKTENVRALFDQLGKKFSEQFAYLKDPEQFNAIAGELRQFFGVNRDSILEHLLEYLVPAPLCEAINRNNKNFCSVCTYAIWKLLQSTCASFGASLVTVFTVQHVAPAIRIGDHLLVFDYSLKNILVTDLREYRRDENGLVERYRRGEKPYALYQEIEIYPQEAAKAFYLCQLGEASSVSGQLFDAIEYYQKALAICEPNDIKPLCFNAYIGLSKAHLALQNYRGYQVFKLKSEAIFPSKSVVVTEKEMVPVADTVTEQEAATAHPNSSVRVPVVPSGFRDKVTDFILRLRKHPVVSFFTFMNGLGARKLRQSTEEVPAASAQTSITRVRPVERIEEEGYQPVLVTVIHDNDKYDYFNPALLPDKSLIARAVERGVDTSKPHQSCLVKLEPVEVKGYPSGTVFTLGKQLVNEAEDPRVMRIDGKWGMTFVRPRLEVTKEWKWNSYFTWIKEDGTPYGREYRLGRGDVNSKNTYFQVLSDGRVAMIDRVNVGKPAIQRYVFENIEQALALQGDVKYWDTHSIAASTILTAPDEWSHVGFNTIVQRPRDNFFSALVHFAKIVSDTEKYYHTAVVLLDKKDLKPLGMPVILHNAEKTELSNHGSVVGVIYEIGAQIAGDKIVSYAGVGDGSIARFEEPVEKVIALFWQHQKTSLIAAGSSASDWKIDYGRLADELLPGEKGQALYRKVTTYYRDIDYSGFRNTVSKVAITINKAMFVQEVYGVGYPFYGNVDIRRRNYETLKAVKEGKLSGDLLPQRLIPDMDMLLVYESDKGPWSMQPDMDSKMVDNFIAESRHFTRQWGRVFEELSREYNIINKVSAEGDADPVELYMQHDKMNVDFVPVPKHIWLNMPVFVLKEDIGRFKFVRDLLFTAYPLSSDNWKDFKNVPLEYRRNFALQLLAASPSPMDEKALFGRIVAIHPYKNLIELYDETRIAVEALFREALKDAADKEFVTVSGEGKLAVTQRGKDFLAFILKKRTDIIEHGYSDELPSYYKEKDVFLAQQGPTGAEATRQARTGALNKELVAMIGENIRSQIGTPAGAAVIEQELKPRYTEIILSNRGNRDFSGLLGEALWKLQQDRSVRDDRAVYAFVLYLQAENTRLFGGTVDISAAVRTVVKEVSDPQKVFVGEFATRLAVDACTVDPLPELSGKTVLRYREGLTAADFEEAALLRGRGIDTIYILPYVPDTSFKPMGRTMPVVHQGLGIAVTLSAGRLKDENGNVLAVLCADGLVPGDSLAVARWLNESPALHGRIARLLSLDSRKIEPVIIEVKQRQAAQATEGLAYPVENYLDVLKTCSLIYRGNGAIDAEGEGSAIDRIRRYADASIDETAYKGMDSDERLKTILFNVYQPEALRKKARPALGGIESGEEVLVSAVVGDDSRKDAGIGEFKDVAGYYEKRIAKAGGSTVQLLPVTLPAAFSPFDAVNGRAGDYALLDLTSVPEVKALLKKNELSYDQLRVATEERKRVDRARVIERKFAIAERACALLLQDNNSDRMKAYRGYCAQEDAWLNGYAERMAAARILGVAPRALQAADIASARSKEDKTFDDSVETYKYLQWNTAEQIKDMTNRVHNKGGKVRFWLEVSRNEYAECLSAVDYWFAFGFDGVCVNITDPSLANDAVLGQLRTAVSRAKPGATVTIRLPENTDLSSQYLRSRYDFITVKRFSEVARGGKVTGNDVVEFDSPDASFRPHREAGAQGTQHILDFYRQRIEKVHDACGVLFVIGNLWGDDVTLIDKDDNGSARWDYRMPFDGEVSDERVKNELSGWTRDLMNLATLGRFSSYSNGYTLGSELFKAVNVSDAEVALLKKEETFTLSADGEEVRTVTGYGLHCLTEIYQLLFSDRRQGEGMLRFHTRQGNPSFFSLVYPILRALAAQPGENRKYWKAALLEAEELDARIQAAHDPNEKAGYCLELFGFARALMEKTVENRDLKETLPLASDTDRGIKRALLGAADSFVSIVKDAAGSLVSVTGMEKTMLPENRALLNHITLLMALGKYAEAGFCFKEYARKFADGRTDSCDSLKTSLEVIELLNRYARKTGDDTLARELLGALKGGVDAARLDTRGLVSINGAAPVEIQALYYNALMVCARFDTINGARAKAAAVRKAILENYGYLFSGEKEVSCGVLYLLALSEVASADHTNDLIPLRQKQILLASVEKNLLGAYGVKEKASDNAYRPALMGLYLDALINVRGEQLGAKGVGDVSLLQKIGQEARETMNPLLEVALKSGTVPDALPVSATKDPSDEVAIAELYRIFDLFAKPQLPALANPDDAFKQAIKAFDIRSVKGMKGAA